MDRLDPRAMDRIKGPAWKPLRAEFEAIHDALIGVSPTVSGELTTIYVKYGAPELGKQPFAVVWVKKASEIIVGLAMPADELDEDLSGHPPGYKYAGLTGYFRVTSESPTPRAIANWAATAYALVKTAKNL